ncbi:MAG: hypothetical protein JO353_10640 [Phycisphaerae bacterium]|nr:hypothetical protein [Phycisphaerae bacterium]
MTNATGQFVKRTDRSNFRSNENLSYGYATPFSSAIDYRLTDTLPGEFVLMADKGPPQKAGGLHGPASNGEPLSLMPLNSRNHEGAGQNVLYADGSVVFVRTPYCGVGGSTSGGGDNIYSALTPAPLKGEKPRADAIGFWGPSIGPSWKYDSYVVPIEGESPR